MARFDINVTDAQVFWSNLLQGFGQSIAFTPMAVVAFSTLPAHKVTEGSAVFTPMRNFGSSLFISLSVLVVVRSTASNYARLAELVNPYRGALVFPGTPTAWGLDSTAGLLRLSGEVQRQAAMIGYVNAFHVMAVTAAAAVPLAWLLKRPARGG